MIVVVLNDEIVILGVVAKTRNERNQQNDRGTNWTPCEVAQMGMRVFFFLTTESKAVVQAVSSLQEIEDSVRNFDRPVVLFILI